MILEPTANLQGAKSIKPTNNIFQRPEPQKLPVCKQDTGRYFANGVELRRNIKIRRLRQVKELVR